MSRTVSPVSSRPYGLAAVCRAWRAPRATVYRRRVPPLPQPLQRPGPVGPMPDAALLVAIRAVVAASPFHGEGHRKIWARLRIAGVRTSKRRVLRLMRENNLLAPSRVGTPRGPRSHDGTIIPETVDTMWGTDLTTTIIGEGQVAVFIAMTIAPPSASASMPHSAPLASRRSHLLTFVSSSVSMTLKPAGPDRSVGIISVGILKDPNDPQWDGDPGMTEWRGWMDKYYPEGDKADGANIYAYLIAQTLVRVLKQCGNDLSGGNIMRQAANLHDLELPLLLPGIRINTSPTDYRPVKQMQPIRFNGRNWDLFGELIAG